MGMLMKDLSYLQVFSHKVLRVTLMIMRKGFTSEDIEAFIENHDKPQVTGKAIAGRLERPCCGDGEIDKELAENRAKQKERKARKKEVM